MALSTKDPRPVDVVQTIADHWGVTAFTVRTPQDGAPQQLEIQSESWTGAPGPDRDNVTPMKMTVIRGLPQLAPHLAAAGAAYEAARGQGVDAASAMYLALKTALEQAQQQAGMFPEDAS